MDGIVQMKIIIKTWHCKAIVKKLCTKQSMSDVVPSNVKVKSLELFASFLTPD